MREGVKCIAVMGRQWVLAGKTFPGIMVVHPYLCFWPILGFPKETSQLLRVNVPQSVWSCHPTACPGTVLQLFPTQAALQTGLQSSAGSVQGQSPLFPCAKLPELPSFPEVSYGVLFCAYMSAPCV